MILFFRQRIHKQNFLVVRLRNIRANDNAEELSGQIEGDMLIDSEEHAAFSGRIEESRRWPNNRVPYFVNSTFFSEL